MNAKTPYLSIPIDVLTGDNFKQLSGSAIRLLIDACLSLKLRRGRPINNGELRLTAKEAPDDWRRIRPPFERKVKQEVKQKAPLINNVVPINGVRKEIIDSRPEGFIGVMS